MYVSNCQNVVLQGNEDVSVIHLIKDDAIDTHASPNCNFSKENSDLIKLY